VQSEFSAVIFDMDGVLIDAKDWHYEALNEALSIFGEFITREEHLEKFDGLPTKTKLRMLEEEGRISRRLFPIVEAVKQERTLRAAARLCFPRIEHLIMLAELKRCGFGIGVATNSIRLTANAMLNFAGVVEFLDVLVTNEDVKRAKPDPEIYLSACSKLGIQPKKVLVIEDNRYGVEAATLAGCSVLEVSSPSDLSLDIIERRMELIN
jgi:beta-phosphoglucomutase